MRNQHAIDEHPFLIRTSSPLCEAGWTNSPGVFLDQIRTGSKAGHTERITGWIRSESPEFLSRE
jgi:hypothetical protein